MPKNQLSLARNEFRDYLRRSADLARTLRDELKLQAHLGSEEAKSQWAEIEGRLTHLDTLAHDLNHAASDFLDRVIEIVRDASVQRQVKRRAKGRARRPEVHR